MAYKVDLKLITDFLNENNLNINEFGKKYKISKKTLKKLMVNDLDFPFDDIFKIAKAINRKVYEFFIEN